MIPINEQSVFPDAIDPLIFFADADLDNRHYLDTYYALLISHDYVGASEYLQGLQTEIDGRVVSPIAYYGAWLLNLYENELFAIEDHMPDLVPENSKPKLVHHGRNESSDPAYTHWVYYDPDQ